MSISKQQTIGNYQIISVLGQGGMGKVYKAWDPNIKRVVALKTILPNQVNDAVISRFYREANAVSKLDHPSIVKIHMIAQDRGVHYFTMDYIEGCVLTKYVEIHKLSATKITTLMRKIAKGVHYAHTQGVIHRDLKPDNILVDNNGNPHIMDFGLAKVRSDDKQLTKTGDTIGTPFYMSPEQALGHHKDLDERSDIFALGAILYKLLTGDYAFPGETLINVIDKIINRDPIPPRQINNKIPKSLESICLVALSKIKNRRYPSALKLADDLGKSLRGRPVTKMRKISYSSVITIFTMIVIASFLTVFYHSRKNDKINIDHLKTSISYSQKKYITASEFLLRQEPQKALEILRNLQKKPGNVSLYEIYEKIFLCYVEMQDYQKAMSLFEQMKTPSSLVKFRMAKVLREQHQNSKVLELLDEVISSQDKLTSEAIFYKGFILLEDSKYSEALKCFELISQHSKPVNFLYQAICYFHTNNYSKAQQILNKAQKLLPGESRIYEYQARTSYAQKNYKQALLFIKKAITFAQENDEYYMLQGEIQNKLNLFSKAKESLVTSLQLNALNTKAIRVFMNLAVEEPEIENDYFWTISYYVGQIARIERPETFRNDFAKICEENRAKYNQWLIAQQNKYSSPEVFVEKLKTSTIQDVYHSATRAIVSLRYYKDCENLIKKAAVMSHTAKVKKRLQTTLEILQKTKREEQKQALSYLLCNFYLNKNRQTLATLENNIADIQLLLQNTKEISILRYAAAHVLASLAHFKILEDAAQSNDITLKMISRCILRDFGHFIKIANEKEVATISDPFIIACMCRAMNFPLAFHPYATIYRERVLYLKKWLYHKNPHVQIYAAGNIARLSRLQNMQVQAEVQNILQHYMRHENSDFRNCAHYYFWFATTQRNFDNYKHLYSQALRDSNATVAATALFFSYYFTMQPFTKELIELIKHKDLRIKLPAIYALAGADADHPYLKKLLEDREKSFFIRATVAVFSNYRRLVKLKNSSPQQALLQLQRNMRAAEEQTKLVSQDPNEPLRVFVYFCNAFIFSDTPMHLIAQETPNIKAHLLLNSIGGYKNPMFRFLKRPGMPINKKRDIVKKYINSTDQKIRKAAIAAFIALSAPSKRRDLVKKYRNKDERTSKGVAQGFYNLIYLSLVNKFPVYQALDRVLPDQRYLNYLQQLGKVQDKDMLEKYKKWLSLAIEFSPQAKYLYERAIIYRIQNKETYATADLKRAISMVPDSPLYLLELADLQIHRNSNATKTLKKLQELRIRNSNIYLRMGKIYWKLKNIKKAKLFFYKCLIENKETYHMIAYLDNIEANIHLARIFAYEGNLESAKKYLQYYDSIYRRTYAVSIRNLRPLTKSYIFSFAEFRVLANDMWIRTLGD